MWARRIPCEAVTFSRVSYRRKRSRKLSLTQIIATISRRSSWKHNRNASKTIFSSTSKEVDRKYTRVARLIWATTFIVTIIIRTCWCSISRRMMTNLRPWLAPPTPILPFRWLPKWLKSHKCLTVWDSRPSQRRRKSFNSCNMSASRASSRKSTTNVLDSFTSASIRRLKWIRRSFFLTVWLSSLSRPEISAAALTLSSRVADMASMILGVLVLKEPSNSASRWCYRRKYWVAQRIDSPSQGHLRVHLSSLMTDEGPSITHPTIAKWMTINRTLISAKLTTTSSIWTMHKRQSTWWLSSTRAKETYKKRRVCEARAEWYVHNLTQVEIILANKIR